MSTIDDKEEKEISQLANPEVKTENINSKQNKTDNNFKSGVRHFRQY